MSRSLVWKDLNINQIEQILNIIDDREESERRLAELFDLSLEPEHSDGIILDFYYFNLVFAIEQNFTAEKLSTFFSLMKDTFYRSMDDPNINEDSALNMFKTSLIDHSVHRPPFSVQIFSFDDVEKIADFAVNSFFEHFKMYQYVFQPKEILSLTTTDIFRAITHPPSFPPLKESLPEEEVEEMMMVWTEEEPVDVLRDQLDDIDLSQLTPEIIQQVIKQALHAQVVGLKREQRKELDAVEEDLVNQVKNPSGLIGQEEETGKSGKKKPATPKDKKKKGKDE
ncbi:putative Flagellar C1a complex subunit C1a-32 [Blattamonas nauphoetae]|uniref:Flagellar C1a complex subunit C1a-32 n=1 Tax=Blattamonas nauphoetae TaxID=2049346 RepID=A0ABQ9YMI4_9EUKA|nr:putative Flagellar C1a complex subunit C1a-32 [Blattamonas nauphoetae]